MKKLVIFVLTLLFVLSLSACGSRDIDELKTMISSMQLDYADEDYAGEDYDGVEIAGRGSIVMYEPTYDMLMVDYASEGKLAMLDFEVSEAENEQSIYITYLNIGYIDQKNQLFLDHEYSSVEIDGYRIDMSMEQWINAISYYNVETVLEILVDLGIIIKE
jgi:hypothetical protein